MAVPRAGGCHTCRTRKIKCDMAMPVCQRCVRARRTCVPNPAKQALTFHLENKYVTGEAKRPKGPRSSYSKSSVPLEELALAYYLQHHIHITTSPDEPNLGGGWSECISQWRAFDRSCGIVDLALSALSLVVYARIHNYCPAAKLGASKYSELLQWMHAKLQSESLEGPACADIDGALLIIFLMGRYENTVSGMKIDTSQPSPGSLPLWSHHDGALAVLRTWYSNMNTPAESSPTNIIKMSRRGLIRSHILRNRSLPDWLIDGELFGERDSDLAYDRLFVRLANFRRAVTALEQQHAQVCTARMQELDREGIALRSAFLDLRDKFLSTAGVHRCYQKATVIGSRPWPRLHFYSSTVYLYASLTDAAAWLNYFAVSLLLVDTSVRVFQLLQPAFEWKRDLPTRHPDMANLCQGFAATIPFCLERVKAPEALFSDPAAAAAVTDLQVVESREPMRLYLSGLVAWPLTIASSLLHCLDDNLRRWAKQELSEMGRIKGDGGLVAVASAA